MLLRTIGHLLGLDAGWFMYDLLWVFIGFVFINYAVYVLFLPEGEKPSIKGFIFLMVLLYAILDIISLAGLEMFTMNHMLTFTIFQMCTMVLTNRTRFAKYNLVIFVAFFFITSWLVTPAL